MTATVVLENLSYAWPGQPPCLQGIHLSLHAGERVFLRGQSGSGKSSLLTLIAGIALPQHGDVRLLGQSLAALSAPARDRFRAEHLGILFQQFNLLPYLSARENVLLPCRISAARAARCKGSDGPRGEADRLLNVLEIPVAERERAASRLSVGQQQRVAAARALIGQPALILADEPTSALDAARQRTFINLLLEESGRYGGSVLFVSHDTRLANRFERTLELSMLQQAPTPALLA